jgi:hypothetical protein
MGKNVFIRDPVYKRLTKYLKDHNATRKPKEQVFSTDFVNDMLSDFLDDMGY